MTTELRRITVNPEVCGGRPCIRGTRVRVKDVLDLLAAGAAREEILADYRSIRLTHSCSHRNKADFLLRQRPVSS